MKLLRFVLPAAAVAASLAPIGGAQAQVFFRPFGGVYAYDIPMGPPPGPSLGPYANRVSAGAILARRGYDLEGPIERRGDVLIAHGYSPERGEARFVIDAYDGEVLSVRRRAMALARDDDDDDEPAARAPAPRVLRGPADIRPSPQKPLARSSAQRATAPQAITPPPTPHPQPNRLAPTHGSAHGSSHMAVTPPPPPKPAPALAQKPAAPTAPFLEQKPPISPIIRSGG